MQEQRQFTIEMKMQDKTRRLWSGSRNLVLNGNTYEGTFVKNADGTEGSAIMLRPQQNVAGEVGTRCGFTVAVTDESLRRRYSIDQGPIECTIQWIYNRPAVNTQRTSTIVDYDMNREQTSVANVPGYLNQNIASRMRVQVDPNSGARNSFWNARASGTTASTNTGPNTNNTLNYVYFETTSSHHVNSAGKSLVNVDGGTNQNLNTIGFRVNTSMGTVRTVRMLVCLQGGAFAVAPAFDRQPTGQPGFNPAPGLWFWSSASDPNFSVGTNDVDFQVNEQTVRSLYRHRIAGWAYSGPEQSSDGWQEDDTIFDEDGISFAVAFDGGWRWVEWDIPAGHTYFGWVSDVENAGGGSAFLSDVAVAQIQFIEESGQNIPAGWEVLETFVGQMSAPNLNVVGKTFDADIEDQFGRLGDGRSKNWTEEQQRIDYPGITDNCFENLEAIQRDEINVVWD